uniref:Uncharacterized protein n=1 Tax=mine drainage metagenome TaxID=410659 RepID=E6PN87_9ZZZZ
MMRTFLKNNKIFFETIATTLLALMALIVSTAQWRVAADSRYLANIRYLPHINAELSLDNSREGWQTDKFVISNSGGDVYDLASRPIAFLDIRELQLLRPGQKPDPNMRLKSA